MVFLLISIIILAGLIYWLILKPQRYWADKGFPQTKPIPIFGENAGPLFRVKSFAQVLKDVYEQAEGKRYMGFYQFTIPSLLLKDPELIKQITVKDFDYFTDHRTFIPEAVEALWGKNLLALKGNRWREMRAILSPTFTASKMKMIFNLVFDCAKSMTSYYEKQDKERKSMDMRDVFSKYANDVIASAAFGVNCDSYRDGRNEFYLMGKEAIDFSVWRLSLKLLTSVIFPGAIKFFGLRIFSKRVSTFFIGLIKEAISIREKKNIFRPDMVHLLMEARKGRNKHNEIVDANDGFAIIKESQVGKAEVHSHKELTDLDITAQALIFFFAGFETVSGILSFTSYELAVNPDVQLRLQNEIDETMAKCNGKLTYDFLMRMTYMDMVVTEALRLWPPILAVDRVCVKPYDIQTFEYSNEKSLRLEKGDVVMLPIFPIMRDPQYYPNPNKFDPERFNEENKVNIHPYTYLPFGSGPRGCIGSRFALMEVKTLIFVLLAKFDIVVTEKTQIPVQISKKQFNLDAENGIWLGLKLRSVN